jgi:hypothetical protein
MRNPMWEKLGPSKELTEAMEDDARDPETSAALLGKAFPPRPHLFYLFMDQSTIYRKKNKEGGGGGGMIFPFSNVCLSIYPSSIPL